MGKPKNADFSTNHVNLGVFWIKPVFRDVFFGFLGKPLIPCHCLLLTDGQSQDDVGNSARAIKNSGVKMFALGIGAARVDELKLIASPPFADTMYYETDYDAIKQLQEKLTNKFCEEVDSYGLYPQGFKNTNLTGLLPVSR